LLRFAPSESANCLQVATLNSGAVTRVGVRLKIILSRLVD
jgi:hypothetical protein